jgi:hypothetical protein
MRYMYRRFVTLNRFAIKWVVMQQEPSTHPNDLELFSESWQCKIELVATKPALLPGVPGFIAPKRGVAPACTLINAR